MAQLNLAAEVFRARLVARRRKLLYVLAVVLLLLAVGGWALPFLLARGVQARTVSIRREIKSLQAQLNSRRDEVKKIILFRQQLALLKERLDGRIGWSRVLTVLERLTPPEAVYDQLGGSQEESRLSAEVLVPNLDTAADLIASLQQAPEFTPDPFASVGVVSVDRVQVGETEARYRIRVNLTAAPEVFRVGAPQSGGL